MIEPHELRVLTAHLGAPHFEQVAHRRGEAAQLLVHWGCGCAAIGTPSAAFDRTVVRWSRCDHHAQAEHALA